MGDLIKNLLNFHESWLLALEFQMGVTKFYGIFKGKALPRISKGKVTKLNVLSPLCLNFF